MLSQIWFLLVVPGVPMACLYFWIQVTLKKREQQYRRPFNSMPRPAGYSLQLRKVAIGDKLSEDILLCMMIGMSAWTTWISGNLQLWLALLLGLVSSSIFAKRAISRIITYSNHRLGLLGEQVVGQVLDRLASDSIQVFHDLEVTEPGQKPWNIDHVVLTPAGVFAIETKTRRKARGTSPDGQKGHKVIFDGQQLRFPAPMSADRHGIEQALRNAEWLSGKLTALNGCPIPVIPVLVLPGWWVEAAGKGPVTAINHNQLRGFLSGRTATLSQEHQRAIAAQLEERTRIDLSLPS